MANLTGITADDWIVVLRLERDGKVVTKRIGVSPEVRDEKAALRAAIDHVNTMRMRLAGRAWKVLDGKVTRRYKERRTCRAA